MDGSDPLFSCEGEMAGRMAAHDWADTPLGPSSTWSQSLRTAVSVLLRSRYPMILSWGQDFVMLYNDAFIPTLGAKHPRALGGFLPVEFAEVWDDVGPMQHSVLAGGPSTWAEDLPLVIERGEGPEEAYFTFSYSHVPDEAGPGGVLAVLSMTTAKVVAARRMSLLNELAQAAGQTHHPDEAVAVAMGVLAAAPHELRCGALYRLSDEPTAPRFLRVGSFGSLCDDLPQVVDDQDQPIMSAWRERLPLLGRHTCGRDEGRLTRVAIPVRVHHETSAVMVLCPHPLRPYDDEHARFAGLVADQVGRILGVAGERAREQARIEALAALDAAKTAFLSNVSHEFRTPLTLLLGPLEDVLTGRAETIDRSDLEVMHHSAHRLLRMVNALLDVARIEADGLRANTQATDLAELTRDLLPPFRSAAERARLTLRSRLDPTLGIVEMDPELWEKIVLNLVANAIKFTLDGSIDVDLARSGDQIVLRVADTGVGIPEPELDRVFDRFHRVQNSGGRSIEGTGVGLAVVADAARALGGAVTVTSRTPGGSTFEVVLPLVAADAGTEESWSSRPFAVEALARDAGGNTGADVGAAAHPARGRAPATEPVPSILVAEDNVAMRSRLARVLADLGEVLTAPDGRRALEVLREQPVDLVVTDVMMPELDGLELLREIRADPELRSTPVVLLSARAGPEAAAHAIESGADDYVVKPFTPGELQARCRTSLELAQHRAADAANRARSTLLAGVSHDMQSPLAVISSTLELLSEDDLPSDLRRHTAFRALTRASQLAQLIAQFLDWSRLTTREPLPVRLGPTDVQDLAGQVASQYEGVHVRGDLAGVLAVCDPQRTKQILHNLLGNAERAARSSVEVRLAATEDAVLVRVIDNGAGVSPEVLPRLFEAFGPTAGVGGTGLGLHISRESSRAQGGDLTLESSTPEGSVFALRLPREGR
jgi:signal transduction histidine kinase